MKVCTKCKESKELEEFGNHDLGKDGLRTVCKECGNKQKENRIKTKEGKLRVIYDSQVSTSKRRGHKLPTYTKEDFVKKYIDNLDYTKHYYGWVTSNYSKDYSPSFDRKDDYKGYSFDNLQIMYWFENNDKYSLDTKEGRNNKRSKAVIGTNIKTKETIEFYSCMEAGRNGFDNSSIGKCCVGKEKTHKGYTWKHKN